MTALAWLLALAACGNGRPPSELPAGLAAPSAAGVGLPALGSLDGLARKAVGQAGYAAVPLDPARYIACSHGVESLDGQRAYLPPAELPASYALYSVEASPAPQVLSAVELRFTCDSADAAWIALANFAVGRWELHPLPPPATAESSATARIVPRDVTASYCSPSGRVYLAVLSCRAGLLLSGLELELRDDHPLPAPTGVTASGQLDGIHVAWEKYADPRADGLRLHVTGPGYDTLFSLDIAQTSKRIYGLIPGLEYSATVRAARAAGVLLSPEVEAQATPHAGRAHAWEGISGIDALELLPDGTLLVAGRQEPAAGFGHSVIARLGPTGQVLSQQGWARCTFNDLVVTGSGVYAAGGYWDGGWADTLLVKLNLALEPRWARCYSAPQGLSGASALAVDAAGDIALAVGTSSSLPVYEPHAVLLKYSPAGELRWQRGSAAWSSEALDVAADPAGKLYFAGSSLWCVAADGELEWERQLRYPGWPDARIGCGHVLPRRDGGCWMGGSPYYGHWEQAALFALDADGSLGMQRAYFNHLGSTLDAMHDDGAGGLWVAGGAAPGGMLVAHWTGALELDYAARWSAEHTLSVPAASGLASWHGNLVCAGAGAGISTVCSGMPLSSAVTHFVVVDPGFGLTVLDGVSNPQELTPAAPVLVPDDAAGTALVFSFTP